MRQRPRSRRTRAVIVALALATALAVAATPAGADVGSVYFDANNNAAAGNTNSLFNATFTGSGNVGLGPSVMPNLTIGDANTAVGDDALAANTTGDGNVATGRGALITNVAGHDNVAAGFQALFNATASRNVAIGSNAGVNLTTGGRNIDIANPGVAGESGTIRIGTAANQSAAFLAGVWNKTISGPTKAVVVNAKGRLGTAPAPAAPLSGQSQTLNRLRAENRRQSDRLQRQSTELHQMREAIQRLRNQVQEGG
jgi:hypothetical protein